MTNSDRQLELQSLDVAIAERLGIAPKISWEILNEDESASAISFDNEAQARWWLSQREYLQSTYHVGTWKIYPPYSSDISSAMKVVEKTREQQWFVEIANTSAVWVVNFIYDINERRDCWAESESLPEAICRAALAALEGK